MLNKKFMLMAIFIVSLLAISAVSASDLNSTDEIAIDDDSSDIVSVSDEDCINANSKGTFTDLQNMINKASSGSTISLEKDYCYDDGFDTEGIQIYRPLYIDGNGHTINALGKSRIFNISDNDVVLDNIKFCNGKSAGYGGAILFNTEDFMITYYGSNVFGNSYSLITNCTFVNNVADEGAAIYDRMFDEEYRSQLLDCRFVNNSAENGQIVTTHASFLIEGCTFNENFAIQVIECWYKSTLTDCLFVKNSASKVIQGDSWINILRCTFDSNSADDIIYCHGAHEYADVEDCLFVNNSAVGIRFGDATNCRFINNSGSGLEGGTAVNCTFINNSNHGIYAGNAVDCTFIGNSAVYGGAFEGGYASSHSFMNDEGEWEDVYDYMDSAVNCTFIGNSAEYGGAIYDVNAVNCTFINNSADLGGAIYDSSVVNCYFSGNSAKFSGIISFDELGSPDFNDVKNTGNIKIINCNLQKNDFTDYWGISVNGSDLILWTYIKDKIKVKISGKYYVPYEYEQIDCDLHRACINISDLSTGIYDTVISYSGDSNNKAFEINVPIYIKPTIQISSSNISKYYGGAEKYTVTLTENDKPLDNVNVQITVNGKTSPFKTDSNGKAFADLNLLVGTYDVTSVYNDVSTTSKVNVKSTITAADASGTYLNSKVTATFLNTDGNALSGKQVTFKINGKDYSAKTNSNGVATASIDLGVGNYTVTAVNPVNNEQKQFNLVINKANSAITLVATQSNGITTLTATLTPASATGIVFFSINGENKTGDIKNGKATLTLADLKAGNYNVTAGYNGDNNLNASTNTVTFKIDDVYPVLTAKSVTRTYGTSTKLVVYLKNNKGNAITNESVKVVIGSTVKNIKTDSEGKATLAIRYAPGTYDAKISYETAQTTAKITVKKATPKITAKAKTFKKSVKTKKYAITLKVNQKVKVAIKVNKKTYYAYTNTKGQATFKITKLTKKGKYTATVSSIANKYYNKAKSVKVKITVK